MEEKWRASRNKFPSRRLKTIPGWIEAYTNYDDTPVLQNNKILTKIMYHLPQKELPKCRFVCKAWADSAAKELAKSSLVYFDKDDVTDGLIGMSAFVIAMSKVTIPLIRRVQLVDIDFSMDIVASFFHFYGKIIKELRIEYTEKYRSRPESKLPSRAVGRQVDASSMEIRMSDLRNILLFCVPNLEYLELISPPINLSNEAVLADWYVEELNKSSNDVEGSPALGMNPSSRDRVCNIKRFRIKSSESSRPLEWQLVNDLIWASDAIREIHLAPSVKTLPILNCLEDLGRFSQLKTLIVGPLQTSEFQLLIKASGEYGLQLEHFQCRSVTRSDQTQREIKLFRGFLQEFLSCQKKSLQFLRLHEDTDSPLQLDLSNLSNLLELKTIPVLCNISKFMSDFPRLKILSLSSLNPDLVENLWDSMFPPIPQNSYLQTVKELELPYGMNNALRLQSVVKYFRNVTCLKMKGIYETDILTCLWKAWPELESLTLELAADFEEQTDRIFTGLTIEVLEELDGIPKISAKAKRLATVPSIACLHKLRYLEITLDNSLKGKRYSFTELSCDFGFVPIKNLKTLLVPHSKISETCLAEMRKMDFDKLDMEYIDGGSRWWPS